jgi:hypothetical protein
MGFRDRSSAGRSSIVPFVPGEDSGDRHDRRLSANLCDENDARAAAKAIGLVLKIANDGHHWMFTSPGFVADWWPSSAKLVFNKEFRRGVHCHDWQQALQEIEKRLIASNVGRKETPCG